MRHPARCCSTCLQSLKIARASRAAWNLFANVIMPHGLQMLQRVLAKLPKNLKIMVPQVIRA